MTRTVAIDWSGREKGEAEHNWIAEVEDGRLCELHNGRTRHEVVKYLIELKEMAQLGGARDAPSSFRSGIARTAKRRGPSRSRRSAE